MAPTDYAKGYLITLSGVAIITPDALLIRLAAVDPFTLAAARGLMGGLMVLALSALWYRPRGIGPVVSAWQGGVRRTVSGLQ